jgi:endoglucanase
VAHSSLTLRVSEDAYNGDAMFNIYVDGRQVGQTQAATASHAAGAWQDITLVGDFDAAPHAVEVRFLNDAWGSTPGADRNLYVDSLILGGTVYKGAAAANHSGPTVDGAAALFSTGSLVFDPTRPDPAAPPPEHRGNLTLRVAEDAYRGDAMFNVYVDGKQVGETQVATASHAAGAWQDITLAGDFDAAPHAVEVRFLNDAWGSTPDADRNLYVDRLVLGDRTYQGSAGQNHAGPTIDGAAALYSAGSLVFETSASSQAPAIAPPATTSPSTTAPPPADRTGPGLSLLGVNLAGADFAADKLPGEFGRDYTYPTHEEIDHYAAKGLDVVRVPFIWERLQPTQNGPLDRNELARMDDVVGYATAHGLKVVLDVHNFGTGYGHVIGSTDTPNSAFADFWGKVAGHFAGNADVIFGLMNEPAHQDATRWLASANAAITAIRGSGATAQEILVSGAYWDGAHSWVSSDNATVLGQGVQDPNHNFAFEVHQYLDSDSSGTHQNVVSPTVGVDRLKEVTQWAESTGNRLFLGEFGVSQDATSLAALDGMLAYMDQHAVWQGATYWAAGPWWGDYMFSIEPTGLGSGSVTDKPQMDVLEKYVA